jgi:S-DNA-T family DNA segregation ATPase FtsK/SpoIIIE
MAKHRHSKGSHDAHQIYIVKKHLMQGMFVLFSCISALMLLALITFSIQHNASIWQNSAGIVGHQVAKRFFQLFGYVAYLVPCGIFVLGLHLLFDNAKVKDLHRPLLILRAGGLVLFLLGTCGLCSIAIKANPGHYAPGGGLGFGLLRLFWRGFQGPGTLIILLAIWSLGITWLSGFSWLKCLEWIGKSFFALSQVSFRLMQWIELRQSEKVWQEVKAPVRAKVKEVPTPPVSKNLTLPEKPSAPPVIINKQTEMEFQNISSPVVAEGLPDLSLLEIAPKQKGNSGYSIAELELLSRQLEQHLMDFAIQAQVVAVHPGPVITRFELQLGAGTKVSKLSALAKDLARALSVNRVRVVEVIPGKTVVGLELPNPERVTVRFGEVIASDVYIHALSPLSLALGVDIAGHPMVVDLAKMPHLLVAGTTGSGKSVGINSMILSLLFKSTPEQVRMILVDPKMLELSVYDGIPHLLTPVVTDMREAASALRWCVSEMERRYRLMSGFGVRNIAGFNEKIKQAIADGVPLTDPTIDPVLSDQPALLEPLPYIVVVIDELADMMMVVGKKVEQLIARIAQKARAAGIHLILATQRPSVDVLTGLIKSNIPTRISFQVSSKIDSRTILDQQGAEQLLGYGDMLFLAPGTGAPLRVHGAFVDDNEVHRVADDWRQRGKPNYIEAITQMSVDFNEGAVDGQEAAEDSDPLYDQVVEFVVQNRKASISSVQRRFKIGYNRSARLIEEMERVGILGPLEGGVREVLIPEQG